MFVRWFIVRRLEKSWEKETSNDLNAAHHDNCKRNFNESEMKENGVKASNEIESEPGPMYAAEIGRLVPLAN